MITFEELNLSLAGEIKELNLPCGLVHIKTYVSIQDVDNLIKDALLYAKNGDMFDDVLLDAGFFYQIIKYYTDVDVDDKTPSYVYDVFYSNNLADEVLAALPDGAYDRMYDYLMTVKYSMESHEKNMAARITDIIAELPNSMENINEALAGFNVDDFTNVINLATHLESAQAPDAE